MVDAARVLGTSERPARRRAKAGRLEARQVPTQRGPTWQVRVPGGVPTVDRVDRGDTHDDRATSMLELARLVGELQAKAEAAAMRQARAELLAERRAAAESRIPALAAPQSRPDAPAQARSAEPASEPSTPRWRLLLPLLAFRMAPAIAGVLGALLVWRW